MNCCQQTQTEPKIRVAGMSSVSVDPVSTIDDLTAIARKFGRLVEADLPGAALKLTTATGDLIASVSEDFGREDFAEEVADVLIAAFVVATQRGLDSDDIIDAVNGRLRQQSSEAVSKSVAAMLAQRGFQ
jgi:phosphoribosyl-ATP pyrophosphohydrolase